MKALGKFLAFLMIVGVVAAVSIAVVSRKRLESMSDDEIRDYLSMKLSGRLGEEDVARIQEGVISGIRGKAPVSDHYTDEVADTLEDIEDVESESSEAVAE